jgi:hypothetical protein
MACGSALGGGCGIGNGDLPLVVRDPMSPPPPSPRAPPTLHRPDSRTHRRLDVGGLFRHPRAEPDLYCLDVSAQLLQRGNSFHTNNQRKEGFGRRTRHGGGGGGGERLGKAAAPHCHTASDQIGKDQRWGRPSETHVRPMRERDVRLERGHRSQI